MTNLHSAIACADLSVRIYIKLVSLYAKIGIRDIYCR